LIVGSLHDGGILDRGIQSRGDGGTWTARITQAIKSGRYADRLAA
jgi:hypothetical protein